MYHNVVAFLNRVEWKSCGHLLSQWEQSLQRLLKLSTPLYTVSDSTQMGFLCEQTCGFDNSALVEFLRVYVDSDASPFSGVSAQTLWQLTSCRQSLATILQSCEQAFSLLRWNESSVFWLSSDFEFHATREEKGVLRIVSPKTTSSLCFAPQFHSLLLPPTCSQTELPPRIDVLAPSLYQPLLFFGSHTGTSLSVGLIDIRSQRCHVSGFFTSQV
mgnify:FL=1